MPSRPRRLPMSVLLCAVVFAGAAPADAQTYDGAQPPATTDTATLRAAARAREVRERFALGLRAFDTHDFDRAAAEFAHILRLRPAEPQSSTAHYDLALVYTEQGRLDDAQREFKTAIAADPGFLAAMANLVVVELRRRDLAAARAAADQLAAHAPDSARALYSRGLVALRGGDAAAAEADFAKLLGRNPAAATAHYTLALAEIRLEKLPDAERELRSALVLSPGYGAARFALGTVLLRTGRAQEARAAFERTLETTRDAGLRNLAAGMRDSIPAQTH